MDANDKNSALKEAIGKTLRSESINIIDKIVAVITPVTTLLAFIIGGISDSVSNYTFGVSAIVAVVMLIIYHHSFFSNLQKVRKSCQGMQR